MSTFVKVDRKTGDVLKLKNEESMNRIFNKPTVWLELVREDPPDFDLNTKKIVADIRQSDLSDLDVDVDPSEKRVEGWKVVSLTSEELVKRTSERIQQTDYLLSKIVEDIMVAIATGAPLTRNTFSTAVWNQINERRSLRGEEDI